MIQMPLWCLVTLVILVLVQEIRVWCAISRGRKARRRRPAQVQVRGYVVPPPIQYHRYENN